MTKLIKKILKLVGIFLIIFFIVIIFASYNHIEDGYNMYKEAISNKSIEDMVKEVEQKEDYTKIEDIPKIYINSVVAVEDHRFFEHKGIDVIAILSAIALDFTNKKAVAGGSTITQQLCKNVYFTQERTIERKIAEVFMAHQLEENLTKDKILELYINSIFYGNGFYTIKSASKGYFDVEPINLSKYQATMLAGIPNAPSLYNPKNSLELAKERQKQVLFALVKYGYISQDEKEEILNEDIDLSKYEKSEKENI